MPNFLLVDDDLDFVRATTKLLRAQGHTVDVADTVAAARQRLIEQQPDVLLLDLMLPDGSGFEILDPAVTTAPMRVVFLAGHPAVTDLISDIRGPGVLYLTKPIEPEELAALLGTDQAAEDEDQETADRHFGLMVGESPVMQAVYEALERVARTDMPVLIQGETGTGKELVARAIHRLSGRAGPLVPVNCGGLDGELVGSELFGHERGAFTGAHRRHMGYFERAAAGTLFLDEITEMRNDSQAQLLRVLEAGRLRRVGGEQDISVNARLVAATNRDPVRAVESGRLREDLYYRLRVVPIDLPPLRARGDDVQLLAKHFVARLNRRYDTHRSLSDEALERFMKYDWPGNVRELKHTVQRAYLMESEGRVIHAPRRFERVLDPRSRRGLRPGRSVREVEKELILATLEHFDGDKKAAAQTLGISLKTLYNRLNQYAEDQQDADRPLA